MEGKPQPIRDGQRSTDRPFWSVMIPTYQPDSVYLEATLKSVLQQDPGEGEMHIEVIDDCSPNGAPSELVRQTAGERIIVRTVPGNLGLAGIWNLCIERAKGDWIHILHQDDLVFPGFYQALRKGIQDNPEVGAAFCRHAYCDDHGHWQKISVLEMPHAGVLRDFVGPLVTGYHIQCAAVVVKGETYRRIGGFDPRLKHALDWEMWIRIANSYPLFYEPKILAAWRNHENATTSRQMRSGENIRDIRKAIDIWSVHLPSEERARYFRSARHRIAREGLFGARMFASQGDFSACQAQLAAALRCSCAAPILAAAFKLWLKAFLQSVIGTKRRNSHSEFNDSL